DLVVRVDTLGGEVPGDADAGVDRGDCHGVSSQDVTRGGSCVAAGGVVLWLVGRGPGLWTNLARTGRDTNRGGEEAPWPRCTTRCRANYSTVATPVATAGERIGRRWAGSASMGAGRVARSKGAGSPEVNPVLSPTFVFRAT